MIFIKREVYLGLAIASAISVIATPILAQAKTSISELQQAKGVTIAGKIVGFGEADENEWIIDDGTGKITVDAGPRRWQQINVAIGDRLTVLGEMDESEFDAFSVTKSDGTVINIRPTYGPPPWAGNGRGRK
jgi:Bacterial OB fold (BOF) protein